MKKLLRSGVIFIAALSLAGPALAQEKARNEEQAAVSKTTSEKSTEIASPEETKGKTNPAENQAAAESDIWRMGGLVTGADPKGETITIHQETLHHDRVMKLKVSDKAAGELSRIKPGDLVNVWINGNTVTVLNKIS